MCTILLTEMFFLVPYNTSCEVSEEIKSFHFSMFVNFCFFSLTAILMLTADIYLYCPLDVPDVASADSSFSISSPLCLSVYHKV